MNVYEKLNKARTEFLASGIKKTGKNMNIAYMYFQLGDIIPVAQPIFDKLGLIKIDDIEGDCVVTQVINTEKPDDKIVLTLPLREIEAIVSNSGKLVTNAVQRLGSTITYMRRYTWQVVLDIVEADEIEPMIGREGVTTGDLQPQEKREEIKKELTKPDNNATEMQLNGLKKVCATVLDKLGDEGNKIVGGIASRTKNFTSVSKTECEIIIKQLNDRLNSPAEVKLSSVLEKPTISITDDELPF